MTYLDYSATSPTDEEVIDSFVKASSYFGNPNSLHKLGVDAKKLIDAATKQIADILGIKSSEIIYTSGASESNNMVIKAMESYKNRGCHIITTELEHSSINVPLDYLKKKGFIIDYVPLNEGLVDIKSLEKMLDDANEKSKKINSMYNELHVVLEQVKKYRDATEKYMEKLAKKAERPARWVVGVMMQGLREKFDGNSKSQAVRTLHDAGELYYLRNKKGKLANKQVIDEVYDETEQEVNARNAQARKDMEQAHKNIQNMSDFENDYDDYKGLGR